MINDLEAANRENADLRNQISRLRAVVSMNLGYKSDADFRAQPYTFVGKCLAASLETRGGKSDPHAMVSIWVEDDETWYRKLMFSSYWLNDLLKVLRRVDRFFKKGCDPDPSGYGYLMPKERQ